MATIVIRFINDDNTETAFKAAFDQESFDRVTIGYAALRAVDDSDPKSPTYGQRIPLTNEEAQRAMFEDTVAAWADVAKRQETDVAVEAARKGVKELPPPPIEIAAAAVADVGTIKG